jgi:hypothetical protein
VRKFRAFASLRITDVKLGTVCYRMSFDPNMFAELANQMLGLDIGSGELAEGLLLVDTIDEEEYDRISATEGTIILTA